MTSAATTPPPSGTPARRPRTPRTTRPRTTASGAAAAPVAAAAALVAAPSSAPTSAAVETSAAPAIGVATAPSEPAPLPADRFLDRELSWLAFNSRVLELAVDPDLPLLERARFLAIFASNLDEFFMVRVAGLKRRIATGLAVTAASGLEPREVLEAIGSRAHELMATHAARLHRPDRARP